MANKRMEFFIGIMVLTVFITVIVMTILFGPQRKLFETGRGQRMTIVFDKATGITNNSRVMKSGIEIGRVYKSELIEDPEKSEVRVSFNLNPEAKIYSNEYARINRTILGDAAIEFVKNPKWKGEIIELKPEDAISGVPGGDLTATVSNIEGDLAKAIQSVNSAAQELTLFMGNLNNFLGTPEELNIKKGRLETIFKELNETLITTRSLAGNMNAIVADKNVQNNIRTTAANLPNILSKVDALLGNANILADDFRETMSKTHDTFDLVGKNLDNLNDFTTALSEEGPEFISSMNASSGDIRKMVANISKLSEELSTQMNDSSTPLGMMTDEETADSLRAILKNAEVITEKVHPILDDAKVFSNKIAHKPSSLIWGGRSYKGASPLSDEYNFQPYSPGGGLKSPLFSATRENSAPVPPITRPDGSVNPAAIDPDSYEAYYARFAPQELRTQNCLTSALGRLKFSLGGNRGASEEYAYNSDDPMSYYGAMEEGTYSGEPTPYSGEEIIAEETGSKRCFSLGSLFKKVFRTRGETRVPVGEELPFVSNAVYQPEGHEWSSGDVSLPGGTLQNHQPLGDMLPDSAPQNNAPAGNRPSDNAPLGNRPSGRMPSESAPQNQAPTGDSVQNRLPAAIEELPFEASQAAPRYQGNANGRNLPGPGNSASGNRQQAPIRLVPKRPASETAPGLDPPMMSVPDMNAQNQIAPAMSNVSNTQPSDMFIDDGLPMQFSPALEF